MLIPRPQTTVLAAGWFELDTETVIETDRFCESTAMWLRDALAAATRYPLRPGTGPANAITFRMVAPESASTTTNTDIGLGLEGYRVTVRPSGVLIEAGGPPGAFYAAQTLRSLLPPDALRRSRVHHGPWRIPTVTITDRPRFAWRGTMLDVARHFLPKQDVLRFLDLMALHKLNTLHLHLTDDQGWRMEIEGYPRLVEVGAWRKESQVGYHDPRAFTGRPHGGYYTHDDLREIVAYAAERHITVVPEIDLPGHMTAAIAAYPHLGNTDVPGRPDEVDVETSWGIFTTVLSPEQTTLDFLYEVFDQVGSVFPSRLIGVGGDECPTDEWTASPRAQTRMAELGLSAPDDIRTWFVERLGQHLAEQGRTLFGWDEICDGELPPDAVVASWRGTAGAIDAARRGHDVVLCPEQVVYLDWRQAGSPNEPIPVGRVSDLAHVHAFDPIPAELTEQEAAHVLGAQCNIWTEHLESARAIDYMAFPRLCAFAEAVWGGATDDFAGFQERMKVHEQRLTALGVEFRRESGPQPWQSRPDAPGRPR